MNTRKLEIKTIKGPRGNEISFCPKRGGIITSIMLGGKEILYLDQASFDDFASNVRGGIPILFPNAGPLPEGPYQLKQHGFARTSDKWIVDESGAIETLGADEEMKISFPFDFSLKIKMKTEEDGSVSLIQEVTNNEAGKDLPLSMGLHPYFKVPNERKKDIRFDFPGGEIIEKNFGNWSTGGTTSIDNPKLKDPNATSRIIMPELGTLVVDVSPEYRKIWIWSLPDKDFVCIEPVMRDIGGLVNDPELIQPNHALTGKLNISLK